MKQRVKRRGLLAKLSAIIDTFFFLFAGAASIWLVILIFDDIGRAFWAWVVFFVLLWAALAYLFLPRLHRLFTAIYVPNYFIGRSRTGEGLLGDPVNLAFNGTEEDLHRMMQAAGWTLADPLNLRSSLGIIVSTITGRSYDEAPVSTLKLFGRMQEFAYQQEVDGSPSKRHHIRFWRCPDDWPLPGGSRHVQWMGAASFDRAVGLSLFTLQVTHKIGANIDEERDHVVETLRKVDPNLDVYVLEDFSTAYHTVNGGGDEVNTDGNLPIVTIDSVPESVPMPTFDAMQTGHATVYGGSKQTESELARIPRPLSVYWALSLIGLQVLASGVWLWTVLNHQDQLSVLLDPDDQSELAAIGVEGETIVGVAIWTVVITLVLRLILAWLMWAGYNGGRTGLMIIESITVITNFAQWYQVRDSITWTTSLIPVALAILLLLALSSSSVADYARSKQRWRAHVKAEKRRARTVPAVG